MSDLSNLYYMVEKFCPYCQEETRDILNRYNVWECTNCEPLLSESEESDSDDYINDPDYIPSSSDSDSDYNYCILTKYNLCTFKYRDINNLLFIQPYFI